MARTLYDILGVQQSADAKAIHTAYVKKAAALRGSSSDEASAVKQAYDLLKDPAERARYDKRPYMVADSSASAEGSSLFTMRNFIVVGLVAVLAGGGFTYYQKEQQRQRLERERAEAARKAEEDRRYEEQRRRVEEKRLALEAEVRARAERSQVREQADGRYRTTLDRATELERARIENQRARTENLKTQTQLRADRDRDARERADRAREERQQREQRAREEKYLKELEKTRPIKF